MHRLVGLVAIAAVMWIGAANAQVSTIKLGSPIRTVVSALPGSPTNTDQTYIVTDAVTAADCSTGGATPGVLAHCAWDPDVAGYVALSAAGGSGHVIEDEGTPLTARPNLNFTGAGVTCADDAGNDETDCTIPGATGAPTDAPYLTGAAVGGLSAEVVIDTLSALNTHLGTSIADGPHATGDVVGPGTATDHAVARYDLATGKLLQNSGVTIDDSGNVTANSYATPDIDGSNYVELYGNPSGDISAPSGDNLRLFTAADGSVWLKDPSDGAGVATRLDSLVLIPHGTVPEGPNYSVTSPAANMQGSSAYRASVLLGPGTSTQPNYMRAPDLSPVTTHYTLRRLTHTTSGTSDDTGNEICADVSINTYGYGACVGVDADQDMTASGGSIETSCSATLTVPDTVYVFCGAGAIGTEPGYSSILSGYDNHLNHQAGLLAATHSSIGPGDAGGHATILGGATHYIEGDCEFCAIFGGALNALEAPRTATNTGKSNAIFGGRDNLINTRGLTSFAFEGSYNMIAASSESLIQGPSFDGAIVASNRGGIVFPESLTGTSGSSTDEGRSNFVNGQGAAVTSFDPGDGTTRVPSYAQATGSGGRAWLSNQKCHGMLLGSDTTEAGIDGTDGSDGATAQACVLHLAAYNIAPADPTGTYTSLYTNREISEPIIAMDDGVWGITAKITCQDRSSGLSYRHAAYFKADAVLVLDAVGSGSDTASFYDNSNTAQSTIAATRVGYQATHQTLGARAWTMDAQLSARAGTASVDGGFDVQVRVNQNGDAQTPGQVECVATVDVQMLSDY